MTLKLTNLDKIYWPKGKITKGDMIDYYDQVSSYILPYLKNRPLILHRFPDGIKGEEFYQKNAGPYIPDFMTTHKVKHEDRTIPYIIITGVKSLLYVANLGSIEMHPFNATIKDLHCPSYLVLDLDPHNNSFEAVIETAQVIHEVLEELELPNFCKTSGMTGLHIYVPMGRKYTFDQVKEFAHLIAMLAHARLPKITSLERNPQKRKRKVYIDFLQNAEMQSVVAPYSLRASVDATVSTPLDWKEVKRGLDPTEFTMKRVLKRLSRKKDLFKPVLGKGINLIRALKKIDVMYG
jgi:bifunctional non-homologous end joining protein LigD